LRERRGALNGGGAAGILRFEWEKALSALVSSTPPVATSLRWRVEGLGHVARARLRLISALVLLTFVVCHLVGHIFLLVSIPLASTVLGTLMMFWWTKTGGIVLATALLVHYSNALWSIYVRRYLRLSRMEWAQLGLGLAIVPLLVGHVVGTRISSEFLGVAETYDTVLVIQWVLMPSYPIRHIAAVLTVWVHASIGIHFWLHTKRWYPAWRGPLAVVALLIPTLAIAGYVAAGNHIVRQAATPGFVATTLRNADITEATTAEAQRIERRIMAAYFGLLLLPFAGRTIRGLVYRLRRQPVLTHSNGQRMRIQPGATVLETLRANRIPHASVCGGRARCTTCRIQVTDGLAALPPPTGLEAKALARIEAPEGLRLACQIRPTGNIAIMPLLAADVGAADGLVRGGLEGSERLITVVFVDLRASTTLGEARMPYDVLFILNRFFAEMTKALADTAGHYSQFTGDGLMAIYGLDAPDPAVGPLQALRGAREMLARLGQLNEQMQAELRQPLRMGLGIHYGEAIVGAMGPPRSQIITAIGDTVNTAARLEGLSKDYNCVLILSRRAAEAAGLNLAGHELHEASVKGRTQTVEFYALDAVPEAAA
jgi:adenylate cyclase